MLMGSIENDNMILDGVVFRIDDSVYLSFLDPVTGGITDGIPITQGDAYLNLKDNQVSVAEIIIKDGNLELDNFDVTNFVKESTFQADNIFYNIKDLMMYTINGFTIKEISEKGDFIEVVRDMISQTKKDKQK